MLCLRGCQTPVLYWIKKLALMGPEIPSSTGLGSGGRLLCHFQTPDLYWISVGLRGLTHSSLETGTGGSNLRRLGGHTFEF